MPLAPENGSTSSSLIRRAGQHDPLAWQQLVDLYGPLVYYWCRRSRLDGAEAADVFQEVFTAVSAAISRFRHDQPGHSFRGWLWTITRNKIRDHYRQHGRQAQAIGGSDALRMLEELPERWEESPSDPDDQAELRRLYHRALELVRSEFEERTWQAFWLTAVEGQSTAEVAELLGLSASTIRQYKSRVLRRLRQQLGDLPD